MNGEVVSTLRARRSLALLLLVLAAAFAASSILGPLLAGAIDYHTSDTTLNQLLGADLAGIGAVVPVALVAAVLTWRGHRAGPILGLAPAVWAVYVYAQVIVGQEFAAYPGNAQRFFPLLLAGFVVGEMCVVAGWSGTRRTALPEMPRRLQRSTAVVLFAIAMFLLVGLHLPSLFDALGRQPTAVEYTSTPTAFWVVKLMDLGIVVPAATAIGWGLWRSHTWAQPASYALVGGYTLLSAAVTGMAAVMYANGDPDGSLANLLVFGTFTGLLGWLSVRLYRPLFASTRSALSAVPERERVTV